MTYPLFEYFENWCQDENRHGDFFAAVIKAKPGLIEGLQGRLWSRFFCLSVRPLFYFLFRFMTRPLSLPPSLSSSCCLFLPSLSESERESEREEEAGKSRI